MKRTERKGMIRKGTEQKEIEIECYDKGNNLKKNGKKRNGTDFPRPLLEYIRHNSYVTN